MAKTKKSAEGSENPTGMPVITKALQHLVESNENIKKVYFDENGHHFFHTHTIELHEVGKDGFSKGSSKMEVLPGSKRTIARVMQMVNGIPTPKSKMVHTSYNAIVAVMTREEVLAAEAVSALRSEKEKLAILQAAAEIAKGNDYDSLIEKLKGL